MDSRQRVKHLAKAQVSSRRSRRLSSFHRIVQNNLQTSDIIEGKVELAATMDVGVTTIERWIRAGMPVVSKEPWRFSRREVLSWKHEHHR